MWPSGNGHGLLMVITPRDISWWIHQIRPINERIGREMKRRDAGPLRSYRRLPVLSKTVEWQARLSLLFRLFPTFFFFFFSTFRLSYFSTYFLHLSGSLLNRLWLGLNVLAASATVVSILSVHLLSATVVRNYCNHLNDKRFATSFVPHMLWL